jgi:hypothetical protein
LFHSLLSLSFQSSTKKKTKKTKISRHELESHMAHCSTYGGDAAIEPGKRAMECVMYSAVSKAGMFRLDDFAHLFRAEIEFKGEASAMAMLQWFEMVASRLPEHESSSSSNGSSGPLKTPPKTNSFMPRSLSQYDMEENNLDSIHEVGGLQISLDNSSPHQFTTPPTTAVGSKRGNGNNNGGGPGSKTTDGLSSDPFADEVSQSDNDLIQSTGDENGSHKMEAAKILEDRLEQVIYIYATSTHTFRFILLFDV